MGQHTAIKFKRGDKRTFDMKVGIDKARHGELARAIHFGVPVIGIMGANDAVADNSDVGHSDLAGDDIKQPDIAQNQIRLDFALPGENAFAKMGLGKIGAAHAGWSCVF